MTVFRWKFSIVICIIISQADARSDSTDKEVTAAIEIQAVEGNSVSIPCDVTPPGHDKVYMVFLFQQLSGYPIYSFDVRGKSMSQAKHWSSPEVFGTRAYFQAVSEPAQLVIEDVKRHDEGEYRCRVDFRNAQTRSVLYNLTVIVPPEPPIILDQLGLHLNGSVGPHKVGADILLTCRVVGGQPQPTVRWLINGLVVDDESEHVAGDVIENKLKYTSVSRKDLDAIFTCQAQNTKLTKPKDAVVLLNLFLKPLTISIVKTDSPMVADKRYEVTCESYGSRPPAIITWYKGKRPLRRTKEDIMENVTISQLSFVPSTEDDAKSITCRAENPNATGLFLETSWNINVVYPPIVDLVLGSTLNAGDIKEGDDVYFECKVKANPPIRRLTWLHGGIFLPHNMSNRIIHSNQSLVLQKVTKQSAGVYRCSVVNSEGETVSDELHFRVQYKPMCKNDKIVVVGASTGESIDVICEIESDPSAKRYKWKFNNSGETIELESDRFTKTSNGSLSILKYTRITEMDYGLLSCWAANILGNQINPCVFQIVAAGKPFPVFNCTLSSKTSNSVEVYCQPGFDGGLSPHFLLELYTKNSMVPKYNVTSFNEPYFYLDNLEADVTFTIAVFAVNSKGRSDAVILELATFGDSQKKTATDGDAGFSSLLGILLGSTVTIVAIIVILITGTRSSQKVMFDIKVPSAKTQCTKSSNNTLNQSASPRKIDEIDPDIIPVNYGAAENVPYHLESNNGPQGPIPHLSYPTSDMPLVTNQNHQYSNPVVMAGTFPWESRPKDLCLINKNSSSLTPDLQMNDLAIKERLMANRLPESCV
ncbi:unnamed protein product [Ceutorhynchus assimilis]|uniref:Uncharacterized protein n=1 Tax=Ceutorhynchus assimilis TaxID=467358 RepID=A0A9N9MR45_9CUCU|nr:unnamed protein product [Ceutorhynchus assimilis]